MTKVWGPLGWMTLHSISVNYPEIPTASDKLLVKKFLELFAETISCPSCKGHFQNMYRAYTMRNPNWADSRYNLFLFIVRAHNTVNKRLDKPRPATVADCIQTLQMLTQNRSTQQFRISYINYLMSNWAREGGGEGFIQMGHAREMRKINEQYWNLRETNFNTLVFPEADVLEPIVPVQKFFTPFTQTPVYGDSPPSAPGPSFGFKLSGGRFSFGKR